MQYLGFGDTKKIGMMMMFLSVLSYSLGFLMLFSKTFLLIGNFNFLAGMYFFVGVSGSLSFFRKKGKIRGSALFFVGLVLILASWSVVGGLMQLAGLFIIFRSFLPDIYDYITKLPVVGRYLSNTTIPNSFNSFIFTCCLMYAESYAVQNFLDTISTSGKTSTRI